MSFFFFPLRRPRNPLPSPFHFPSRPDFGHPLRRRPQTEEARSSQPGHAEVGGAVPARGQPADPVSDQDRGGGQVRADLRAVQAQADSGEEHHLRQQRGPVLQGQALPGAVPDPCLRAELRAARGHEVRLGGDRDDKCAARAC